MLKASKLKLLIFALICAQGGAAIAQGKRIAFVGCPVFRDMPLPERPCWLAEDGDQLYYLGMQGDIFPPRIMLPPQLLHRVLVEGEVGAGNKICGGVPVEKVQVSPLPELDYSCQKILPKAGFAAGPILRPSPPYRPGRAMASDPTTWTPTPMPPRPEVAPPFKTRTYEVPFTFQDDFLHLTELIIVHSALYYFEDTHAEKFKVDVFRDRVELTNGEVITESEDVARRRADLLVNNLIVWGVPEEKIISQVHSAPVPNGRNVVLTVQH